MKEKKKETIQETDLANRMEVEATVFHTNIQLPDRTLSRSLFSI